MDQPNLTLTATGPGSRAEIVAYVQSVLEQRTTPGDDTSAERLAQNITTSILHRLGAGLTAASGSDSPDGEVVIRLTLECGHLRLSGLRSRALSPEDQAAGLAPMLGDLTICQVCPQTIDPETGAPGRWSRQIVDIHQIPGVLYRNADEHDPQEAQIRRAMLDRN